MFRPRFEPSTSGNKSRVLSLDQPARPPIKFVVSDESTQYYCHYILPSVEYSLKWEKSILWSAWGIIVLACSALQGIKLFHRFTKRPWRLTIFGLHWLTTFGFHICQIFNLISQQHAIKMYEGVEAELYKFLTRWSDQVALHPEKEPSVPNGLATRWTAEPMWGWRGWDKFSTPARNRNPVVQPVVLPLYRLNGRVSSRNVWVLKRKT